MTRARDLANSADLSFDGLTVDTNTLHVDSVNNRVGIGTTIPATKLHIYSSIPDIRLEDSNTNALVELRGNTGTGSFVIATDVNNAISNSKIIFEVDNDEKVRIDNNGDLGIGTNNPSQKLHVSSSDHTRVLVTAGTDKYAEIQFENDAQKFAMGVQNDDKFFLYNTTGTTQVLTVDTSSNVGINTQSPGNRKLKIVGSSSAFPLALDSTDTDYALEFQKNGVSEWWLKASASNFKIHENGAGDHVTVLSGGNVGIGTDNPGEKLEVDGIIQIKRASDHPAMRFMEGSDTRAYFGSGDWAINGLADADFGISSGGGKLVLGTTFGTGRMTIDTSGYVGIGPTSPDRALHIEGSNFASSSIRLKRSGGGTNNDAGLQFTSAAGANDGHGMGGIWFQNSLDGNAYALMRARTDDSTGTSGRFEFMTNTAGNPVNNFTTPRMTIHNNGAVSMPNQPAFMAKGNNANYITTSPIPFPTVEFNIGNHYNNSNYTFTAPIAGRYFFHAHIGLVNGGSGAQIYPWFSVNGNQVMYSYNNFQTTYYSNSPLTCIFNLSANDTVQVTVSIASATYYNHQAECRFMGYLLG